MALCSGLPRPRANQLYLQVLGDKSKADIRRLCREDLFFLVSVACRRLDINRDWIYARCREIEVDRDGYLDLWAREHYKSTLITFGLTIQDILRDPEITVGFFSHTRPISKAFLIQIKQEFEQNTFLKEAFPDILWAEPRKEAPRWSIETGITVKRKSNPKEATIEAWGLVDGQPTSKHYKLRVYDDVVTRESVTTPEQIRKTTEAWELSQNLGSEGGAARTIGTRYHLNDTYREMIERGSVIPRIYPATEDGTATGKPVLLSQDALDERRRDRGPYVFASQMLQNPVADKAQSFDMDWIERRYFEPSPEWNYYITVDPASSKKKDSDYTAIAVIGLAPDSCYYLVDGVRDRLSLSQRARKVFELHRKWHPVAVGYEQYGMQSDIEHILDVQNKQNYRFSIVPLGGQLAKVDRIKKLIPLFENRRFILPLTLKFFDYEGKPHDLVREFIDDEYFPFPVGQHDDFLDALARIVDPKLNAVHPNITGFEFSYIARDGKYTTNSDYEVI